MWTAVTAAMLAIVVGLGADALALGRAGTWRGAFEGLLVAVCSLAVLGCGAWCWWVTTLTTVDVLRGTSHHAVRTAGRTRQVVLVLCGVAVSAQLAGPAAAASTSDPLHGLSLPDRAVAPAQTAPAPHSRPGAPLGARVVVRAGDTLWSLAEASLGARATAARTTTYWRDIYAANRAAVGPDPDLIHPGQRLRLPSPSRPARDSHSEEQR